MIIASPVQTYWRKVLLNKHEMMCYPFQDDESSYIRVTLTGNANSFLTDGEWNGVANPDKTIRMCNLQYSDVVTLEFVNIKSIVGAKVGHYKGARCRIYKSDNSVWTGQVPNYPVGAPEESKYLVIKNFENPMAMVVDNWGIQNNWGHISEFVVDKGMVTFKEKIEQAFYNNELMNQRVLKF